MKLRTCGGCKGLGSHQRWCVESVGPIASMRGRQAQDAENLADAVGSNNVHAANLLYQAGALLLEQAKTEAALFQEQQADIAMSHVPGMLTK